MDTQTERLAGVKSTSSTLNQSDDDLIARYRTMLKLNKAKKEAEQIERMLIERKIPRYRWEE